MRLKRHKISGVICVEKHIPLEWKESRRFDCADVNELEENGIESVDKIEMKINVVDPDSFSTMKQTDPIVITNK